VNKARNIFSITVLKDKVLRRIQLDIINRDDIDFRGLIRK